MVLDHIGIACEDTSKFLETFTEMLNGHKQMPQLYDEMGISSTYVDFQSTKLELMEQVSETNVLKKIYRKTRWRITSFIFQGREPYIGLQYS